MPITKDYRFGEETGNDNFIESALRKKDVEDEDNYKIQFADYNWFGDLTLGSYNHWFYKGKYNLSINSMAQDSWVQEYNEYDEYSEQSCYNHRGTEFVSSGAAGSNSHPSKDSSRSCGVRLVIEPYNN